MKPYLSWGRQVELLRSRGLHVPNDDECSRFLAAENYYRFSGYARYFQRAPHDGDDAFHPGTSFDEIRAVYDADREVRESLIPQLARAEILLRSHVAHTIAATHGPYATYLREDFYSDAPNSEPTAASCVRDIARSRERHILRFRTDAGDTGSAELDRLPVWSAVEAWSFGTLSKCIERGARGALSEAVATSLGVALAGFPYRVRSLVYLRNRCAHHSRLWNHSVIDAGPTPNNVRVKAKRLAGQFDPRSIVDVIASLDDVLARGMGATPILPTLSERYASNDTYWRGLAKPENPRDHR